MLDADDLCPQDNLTTHPKFNRITDLELQLSGQLFVGRVGGDHDAAPFDIERVENLSDEHDAPMRPNDKAQRAAHAEGDFYSR